MTKALYVGSFDPITNGHINIIERAARLFDEVTVVVSASTSKSYLFDLNKRKDMVRQALNDNKLDHCKVIEYDGLTVKLAEELKTNVLIRGLRSVKDMEYERDIAALNKAQNSSIETVFLMSDEKFRAISSTMVKEIAYYNGDISSFVPVHVQQALSETLNERR